MLLLLSCFSCVQLFATPWTITHQAPLSMDFSKQEDWSGLPFPFPGDLPNPGNKPTSLTSFASAGGYFTTWRRQWQPTPVFLLGEVHGQRSLAGYSPWGRKESDMTEQLSLSLHFHGVYTMITFPF